MTSISIPSIIAASFLASNLAYAAPVQRQRREPSDGQTMVQSSTKPIPALLLFFVSK